MDLISGCTFAILANVLDFRTYSAPNQPEAAVTTKGQCSLWKTFDRNDIPADERMAIVYSRGVALSVFAWIRERCIIKEPKGKILHDLPSKYMVHLLGALLAYKTNACRDKLLGAPHCTSWMLKEQVFNAVKCDSAVERLWQKKMGTHRPSPPNSLTMTLHGRCTVEWRDNAPLGPLMSSELFALNFQCETHYSQRRCLSSWA